MMKDKIEEKNQPKKLKTKQIAIRKKKGLEWIQKTNERTQSSFSKKKRIKRFIEAQALLHQPHVQHRWKERIEPLPTMPEGCRHRLLVGACCARASKVFF